GRLAPSPTGALHLGNARSFLLAWLSVRRQGGKLLMRIEDIDSPRVKPWAREQTFEDLRWLGLDWDWGPDVGGPHASYIQTARIDRYREVLQQLCDAKVIYPCTCTRREVAEAASAPHEKPLTDLQPLEGAIYPGTCRTRTVPEVHAEFAWRWRFQPGLVSWNDGVLGHQVANPERQLGDFVIGKSDSTPAYQLAVVVDDHDMGVTEIVRGSDLVPSTYRQLAILTHLGWSAPKYFHVPLMVGTDGRRLAKRHGDTRLSYFRERGIKPQLLVGYLAWTLGWLDSPEEIEPKELVGSSKAIDWQTLSALPTVFDLDDFLRRYAGH
ncbi:MAG: tRNA glutamyl-Q(34) synthetase GluQRS, partial [Pirellulaceae bacterium]|nr:tRNA glutamyl-Q(34) synthetase GluQRS [Pirellulaceae bacterium]